MGILLELFVTFFKIGAFSFGGGYAMLPLIEEELIKTHNWITSSEFIDILAVSEMTPGPIAINAATFLGYRVYGVSGSLVATTAVVLPSFILMVIITYSLNKLKDSPCLKWFFEGIRPIILGLIMSAAITVSTEAFIDIKAVLISIISFYFVTFKKLNPILAIILAGMTGVIIY